MTPLMCGADNSCTDSRIDEGGVFDDKDRSVISTCSFALSETTQHVIYCATGALLTVLLASSVIMM